jgi:hypothetical protein
MVASNPNHWLPYRDAGPMVLSGRTIHVFDYRQPLTAEDLRIHAWINERLAGLDRDRNSLWPKVRRFLLGGHLLG